MEQRKKFLKIRNPNESLPEEEFKFIEKDTLFHNLDELKGFIDKEEKEKTS